MRRGPAKGRDSLRAAKPKQRRARYIASIGRIAARWGGCRVAARGEPPSVPDCGITQPIRAANTSKPDRKAERQDSPPQGVCPDAGQDFVIKFA